MIIITTILGIGIMVLGYTTMNLMMKQEALEEVIDSQNEVIDSFYENIKDTIARLKEIDRLGSFESDDETGYIFTQMYDIIENVEQYYMQYGTETESKE